jgi:chemotaxis family two-component system sensor kinase Cph1
VTDPLVDADLEACAREPIHIPGSIQPHGVLLALDRELRVVRASANTEEMLGLTVEALLGTPLGEVLAEVPLADLAEPDLTLVNPMTLRLRSGEVVEGVASRSGGLTLLELEPVLPGDGGMDTSYLRIRGLLHRLQRAATLEELVDVTADEVRRLTGFDRVMVYRFDADWNGEVVAEARRDDLVPFLGLWYPAGDIPAQARDLYAATWLRLIASVDYIPVPILPSTSGPPCCAASPPSTWSTCGTWACRRRCRSR